MLGAPCCRVPAPRFRSASLWDEPPNGLTQQKAGGARLFANFFAKSARIFRRSAGRLAGFDWMKRIHNASRHSIHLAHLSRVDCQFVSRPKPFQNNNLQLDARLFSSHLAHFVHAHRGKELWKNLRTGLTKALGSLGRWRMAIGGRIDFISLPPTPHSQSGVVRGARLYDMGVNSLGSFSSPK
jgi:hypothetical protein